jgi:nitroreductase
MNKEFDKELRGIIKARRSVRLFNGKKIPKEDVLSIIEAATWAPTGCNNQELRFLILDEEEKIKEFVRFKSFFKGVSAVILIFCDMSLPMSHKMYNELRHERHLPHVDTGLALANMVLYAKSIGIDSCIINLSEYHFQTSKGEKRIITKVINRIKLRLNLHKYMKNNFEFYLRNRLKLPDHLKIMGGVTFGFAKKYPDVNRAKHGDKRIKRESVNHYIVQA